LAPNFNEFGAKTFPAKTFSNLAPKHIPAKKTFSNLAPKIFLPKQPLQKVVKG